MQNRNENLIILFLCSIVIFFSFILEVENECVVVPISNGIILPTGCVLKIITDYPCPFCGLTRGFISIAHGQMGGAWSFNPMSFAVFLLTAVQIPYRLFLLTAGKKVIVSSRLLNICGLILIIGFSLNWAFCFLRL